MSFDWIWRITTKQQSSFPSLQIVYQNILWVIQVRFLQFNQNCFSTNTDYATYQIHVIISHIKWHSIKLSTKRQEENLEILHYFYKNRKHTMKLAAEGWCTKTWLGLGACCCCCCKAAAAGSWGWKYTLMGCWGWPGCTAEGWTCDCTGWPAEETPWLTTVPVAAETVGGICIWGWGGCPMWWAGGAWWWWWWWCPTRGWYWGCWEGGGACRGCCAGVGPGGGCIFSRLEQDFTQARFHEFSKN